MSTGSQSEQQVTDSIQPPERAGISSHGSSGEGAGSAMAHLISQEQARIFPGTPEGTSNAAS